MSEYQGEKSREQREEKRKLDKQRREQFEAMLTESGEQVRQLGCARALTMAVWRAD